MSEQPKRAHGFAFRACMSIAILVALAVGGVLGYSEYIEDFVQGRCKGYLRALEKGDVDQAYDAVGDAWRVAQSRAEFAAFHARLTESLGRLRSVRASRAEVDSQGADNPTAEIVLAAQFEKGEATVTLVLHREYMEVTKSLYGKKVVRDGEDWFLKSAVYESELLPGGASSPARAGVPPGPEK
jgi:hypothetical protein